MRIGSRAPASALSVFALTLALASPLPARAAEAAPDAAVAARIARVEHGLLPPARIAGAATAPWTIPARLAVHQVPGVAIAVINDGVVEWTRGYGVARAGEPAPVTAATLFQAASISKPVAAAAALTFVEAGKLDLDADVNTALTSWKLPTPALPVPASATVSLRQLLSHTAGLTVSGFPGYAAGAPRPTLRQVLDGTAPANTAPIRVTLRPGSQWRYSGGGYCVLQQLLLDVAGGDDFPTLLRRRVLLPAGMTDSTCEQPLPPALLPRAAAGHGANGVALAGSAHVYPEMAAAGLWTTPGDLARFALALQHALEGRAGFLSRATAGAMITPPLAGSDYGLGLGVTGEGDKLQLAHNGANEGFHCSLVAYPRTGRGAVVMTNSDNGGPLINEILRAIAREYGWPHYQVIEKTAFPLSAADFDPFIGRYDREDISVTVFRRDGRFYARLPDGTRAEIFPQSEREFFVLGSPEILSFERNATGAVTHLIRRTSPPQIFTRSQ